MNSLLERPSAIPGATVPPWSWTGHAMRTLLALVSSMVLAAAPGASTAGPAGQGPAAPSPSIERAHANAVQLFRRARFAEAYGRFIELAEAGHAASARYAVWMCENGSPLFGAAWDCAPHELEAWRALGYAEEARIGAAASVRAR